MTVSPKVILTKLVTVYSEPITKIIISHKKKCINLLTGGSQATFISLPNLHHGNAMIDKNV
jgi:hypothetical protein